MTTLQGYVSTAGEYPSDGSNEVLSAEISDTQTPDEPGIVYANPDVPYSTVQDLAVGAGGQKLGSGGGPSFNSKQVVIYNDPRAAKQAIADLGLTGILINTPPPPVQVVGSNG